jgi:hypothetical protein
MQLVQLKTIFPAVRSLLSSWGGRRFSVSILALASFAVHNAGADPIDAGLFTSYQLLNNGTKVSWSVCGQTKNTVGCYDSGQLGPFGKVGGLLEGLPSTNSTTNTVTRAVYVLDIASGSNKTGVELFIYQKNDVISDSFDTTTITLSGTLNLPINGGTTALVSMAANANYLVVGTNRSPNAVEINKSTLAMTQIGGFSPPINVHAVTADLYGYITIEYGKFSAANTGFITLGSDGAAREQGGGAKFLLDTTQAILPQNLK